jgi:hypothetical protein
MLDLKNDYLHSIDRSWFRAGTPRTRVDDVEGISLHEWEKALTNSKPTIQR